MTIHILSDSGKEMGGKNNINIEKTVNYWTFQLLSNIVCWSCLSLTWCKAEQFPQFPKVASAAVSAVLVWVSPGIIATQEFSPKHKQSCLYNMWSKVCVFVQIFPTGSKQLHIFVCPTLIEDPSQVLPSVVLKNAKLFKRVFIFLVAVLLCRTTTWFNDVLNEK